MKRILTLSAFNYLLCLSSTVGADITQSVEKSRPLTLQNSSSLMIQQTEMLAAIPEEIKNTINLNPTVDSPHINAAKLIKLGLIIQNSLPEQIGARNSDQLNEWIRLCFFQGWQALDYAKHHLPTADYFIKKIQHLIPKEIIGQIPADIILSSDITPDDVPGVLAVKLSNLGHLILRMEKIDLFYKTLAVQCFIYAGKTLEKFRASDDFKESSSPEYEEQIAVLIKSYYQLALNHAENSNIKNILESRIEKLDKDISLAQHKQLFGTMRSGRSAQYEYASSPDSLHSSPERKAFLDKVKLLGTAEQKAEDEHDKLEKRVDLIRHFIPKSAQELPLYFLDAIRLEPHDSPYRRAFKIAKLGQNLIYNKTQTELKDQLPPESYEQIIADCFLSAGHSLAEAIKLIKEHKAPLAPESLMDTAMTGGQYYAWATQHMPSDSLLTAHQSANNLYQVAIDAILEIPEEHYDWRVINDKTLREVILINLEKIIQLSKV